MHEGDERRALRRLAGLIEVVKLVDGIERKIGMRAAGQMFGEIPLVYGTQFQGGYRAVEPTRVLRLDARTTTRRRGPRRRSRRRSATSRASASAGCRASPPSRASAQVMLVGNRWDTACLELRRFLTRNQVTFDWLTPDDPDLPERWPGPPPDRGGMPVASAGRRDDAGQPAPSELAERLGLQTTPRFKSTTR